MLYKVFRIETIHDLANLEFARTAVAICNAADRGDTSFETGFAENSIKKKFRKFSPAMVAEGPVHMLVGISAGKGKLLKRSLGISTIRDLAEMKFVKVARNIDYKEKLIKNYQDTPLNELPEAPLYALQGVSVRDAGLLKKAFGIETIEDFSSLKYFHWAKEIAEAAEKGIDIDREIFSERLVKKYETQEISKLIKAPVSALQGVSNKDGDLIYRAFKVKTIKKFAELKYWTWACGIMEFYRSAKAEPEKPAEKKSEGLWLKVILFSFFIAALLLIIYIFSSSRISETIKKFSGGGIEKETGQSTQETTPAIDAADNSSAEIENEEQHEGYYVVQPGDSLVSISKQIYGTYEKWPEIYRINKGIINSPKLLYPGQKLKLNEMPVKKE
jgi:LysM repeat protein